MTLKLIWSVESKNESFVKQLMAHYNFGSCKGC